MKAKSHNEIGVGEDNDVSPRSADSPLVEGFSERLRQIIGDRSVLKFSRECGISDSLMRKYLYGSLPGLGKLVRLAEVGGVGVEWLATGRQGSGLRDGEPPAEGGVRTAGPDVPNSPSLFDREWLHQARLSGVSLVNITAVGDSMQPTINPGDPLLLDQACNKVSHDAIYAIRWMDEIVPKRLQIDWEGGVWIRSDNPLYKDQRVKREAVTQLTVVGRVVWVGKQI